MKFLAQKPITGMEQSASKGRRFQDTEDIQINETKALKAIQQQEFQKCFQQ